ncbi:Ig-like domain-containing protein [Massilia sp. CCM 8734]|uniref:Ig-like domain-containing protein n=1 Tax=Massilia sp. CCM 8734 TaxID=2609283 RepID=UPI001423202B|nr:Ig-like domain-containing protein [Massilia sp. CCM 8734]
MPQPSYSSATGYISENFFTLYFDIALDAANPPPLNAFNVDINGTGVMLAALTVDSLGKAVNISFSANALTAGDVIAFSYEDPSANDDVSAVQGLDGTDSATFYSSTTVVGGRPGPAAPPLPTLDSGSDSGALGDGITNIGTPTLNGTALANATVKLYDTDGTTLLGSTTADGSGNWSLTSSLLGDGSHTLKVTQTNGASQTSALSAGLALTIDSSAAAPAQLALHAGSDSGTIGDGITNAGLPVITGTAEANASVRLYDSDGSTVLGTATANGAGAWSITSSALLTGSHTLTAKQTDAAGNVSPASSGFAYILDTIGPVGMALSTTSVDASAATSGSTVATLSSTDITSVQYGFAVGNGTIDADNGKFSISGTGLVASQNLPLGAYHIYLKATDAAGNDAFQIFTINVANTPSVTSIVRAGGAAVAVPAATTTVSYAVTFSQSVTGVDAGDFTVVTNGTAAAGIASVTGSGTSYTVTVGGLGGDGSVRLDLNASGTGIESAGNVAIGGGYNGGETYVLDHTALAPTVPAMTSATDTGVSDTDAITSNATPVFEGKAEPGATVRLYDTDGTTLIGTIVADGKGNWSIPSSALSAGQHTVTARQTDLAGNVSSASGALTVIIDTGAAPLGAPLLTPKSDSGVVGDNLTRFATPTLSGSAEAYASVQLFDTDGTTVLGTATAGPNGLWSIPTSVLGDGSHTITARQTDAAGNVSDASAALTLLIDTEAPAAPAAPLLSPTSDSGTAGDQITFVSTPLLSGSAAPHASVTLYDGDGVTVLGTVLADGGGQWSMTTLPLSPGYHALTLKQGDAAGNLSPASPILGLLIEAVPLPPKIPVPPTPTPPVPVVATVDGVPVSTVAVTLPGGASGTQTVIPVITSERAESNGGASTADIALATSSGGNLLLAQLAPGVGLTASGGPSQAAGNSTEHLIQAILASTPGHPAADQSHLTGNGVVFLGKLGASLPLLVETIVAVGGANSASGALTLTGTSNATQATALVVDATKLAAGSQIVLNAVNFAAIVGAANVSGNTEGQILTGDAASQTFSTAADTAYVFSGGGSDSLRLNWAAGSATRAAAEPAATPAPTILHGGLDADAGFFMGNSADYTIAHHESYVAITPKNQPQHTALAINLESLVFADTTIALGHRGEQSALAGLYKNVLGRQADYQGFEFWAQAEKSGVTLGHIALEIISSPEAQLLNKAPFNGFIEHDLNLLYQNIFGRQSDAPGLAFWRAAMEQGVSLEHVADEFLHSPEIAAHVVAPLQWDFIV